MAARTANVVARVEPDIKVRAEGIMEKMGISASTAINMFYRQVIFCNGLPFGLTVPKAYDEMTKEEFDAAMAVGLAEAKAGKAASADEVFDRLLGELANG